MSSSWAEQAKNGKNCTSTSVKLRCKGQSSSKLCRKIYSKTLFMYGVEESGVIWMNSPVPTVPARRICRIQCNLCVTNDYGGATHSLCSSDSWERPQHVRLVSTSASKTCNEKKYRIKRSSQIMRRQLDGILNTGHSSYCVLYCALRANLIIVHCSCRRTPPTPTWRICRVESRRRRRCIAHKETAIRRRWWESNEKDPVPERDTLRTRPQGKRSVNSVNGFECGSEGAWRIMNDMPGEREKEKATVHRPHVLLGAWQTLPTRMRCASLDETSRRNVLQFNGQ